MKNNLYLTTPLKAFDILDCFEDDSQEISSSDLASMVGLPVSSVHRIIQCLEYEGLLAQNKENKRYSLGSKMLIYAQKCGQYKKYQEIAERGADELCRQTGENVNLATCSGDRISNVYTSESHFVLRPNFPLYKQFPAHCTSVGRIFLSHMSDATINWIYENNADNIKMSQEEFVAMLHKTKKDGYATDDEAFNAGLRCAGAPIYLSGKKLLFAISVSAPTVRMDDKTYESVKVLVRKYAAAISSKIQAAQY